MYSQGNLGSLQPRGIDIDAQGNVWVAGASQNAPGSGLMELSPGGVLSPATGVYLGGVLYVPQGVAISGGGVVEVVDGLGLLDEYAPPGSTGSGFATAYVGYSSGETGIAIDGWLQGVAWVSNPSYDSIFGVSPNGQPFGSLTGRVQTGSSPLGVAVDMLGDVWAVNSDQPYSGANSSIAFTTPNGITVTYSTLPATYPIDLAFDQGNHVWVSEGSGAIVFDPSRQGWVSPGGGYTSNSNNMAESIEIDGLGRAFLSNQTSNGSTPGTLTVFANNGTLVSKSNSNSGYAANGTIPASPYFPRGMAIDGSGNCWISGSSPNVVTELVGIAAPVATPLAAQSYPTNRLGVRP